MRQDRKAPLRRGLFIRIPRFSSSGTPPGGLRPPPPGHRLPRLINTASDRALLLAHTREAREISPAMAPKAIADVATKARRPAPSQVSNGTRAVG
uniref:Uncharacterized protein n=1 Tax=Geobacter metallireducens TaxID=28232 RepID=A0A831XFR7_GEOME